MARRRADLIAVSERLGYRLSAAGTHPFARWQDQSVIDTPHYHLVESTLRYVAWRNNTFGIHVHTGHPRRRPGDRGDRRAALGAARAAGGVVQLAVARGPPHPPALDPDADLHPLLSPLRDPRPVRRLGRLRRLRALPDRDPLDPRAHRDLVERAARTRRFRRSRSASATPSPSSTGRSRSSGLMVALSAHYARAYDEGRPLPAHPGRLLEENLWRAIRWGMSGELIDLDAGRSMPARERLEGLVEEVSEVAGELGITPHLAPLCGADGRRALRGGSRGRGGSGGGVAAARSSGRASRSWNGLRSGRRRRDERCRADRPGGGRGVHAHGAGAGCRRVAGADGLRCRLPPHGPSGRSRGRARSRPDPACDRDGARAHTRARAGARLQVADDAAIAPWPSSSWPMRMPLAEPAPNAPPPRSRPGRARQGRARQGGRGR